MARPALLLLRLLPAIASTAVAAAQWQPLLGDTLTTSSQLTMRDVRLPDAATAVACVALAGDGVPWLADQRTVWRLDPDGWQPVPPLPRDTEIRALGALPGSGNVLIATGKGVWLAAPGRSATQGWRGLRSQVVLQQLPDAPAVGYERILTLSGPHFVAILVRADGQLHWVRDEGGLVVEPARPAIGPAAAVFAVWTKGAESIVAARDGSTILMRSPGGATDPVDGLLGSDDERIRDATFDHARRTLFVATSKRVLARQADGRVEEWSSSPAVALGFFAGRLLAIRPQAAAATSVVTCEQRFASPRVFGMLGSPGGPTAISFARQVDSDLLWVEGTDGTQWEWSPTGWAPLDLGGIDLAGMPPGLGHVCMVRTQGNTRVLACVPTPAEGWTWRASRAAALAPDPSGEGFWAFDPAAPPDSHGPEFHTPHGVIHTDLVATSPAAKPRRIRWSITRSDGSATSSMTHDGGHLLIPFGADLAICRSGECRIASLPESVDRLVPAGDSDFDAALLGLAAEGERWRLAAVEVTTEGAPEARVTWRSDFDLARADLDAEPELVPDAAGSVWLASRSAGKWSLVKIVATGRGEVIQLGELAEPPLLLETVGELPMLGDRIVATEHGILRMPRLGAAGSWHRLFTSASVRGFGPGWMRPILMPNDRVLFASAVGQAGPGRAMTLSITSPGHEFVRGPDGHPEAALLAVLPAGSAEPARAIWSDAGREATVVEWSADGVLTIAPVPTLRAARDLAVIQQPTAWCGARSWQTRMLAVLDGEHVAIQRLPSEAAWTDAPLVAPVHIDVKAAEKTLMTLAPLVTGLPDELPAGATRLVLHLATDASAWWCSLGTASVDFDGRRYPCSPTGEVSVPVARAGDHSLLLADGNRTGAPSFESMPWDFRSPAPDAATTPWIAAAAVVSCLLTAYALRRRFRRMGKSTHGAGGLPAGTLVHTFIAYSRKDEAFVKSLAAALDAQGAAAGVKTWFDQRDIPPAADWDQCIDEALSRCQCLLLVLSPDAIASRDVRSEMHRAFELGKKILPLMHRLCEMPRRITLIERLDAIGRNGDDARLIADVLAHLGAAPAPATAGVTDAPGDYVRVLFQSFDAPALIDDGEKSTWLVPDHPVWQTRIADGVLHWSNCDVRAARASLWSSLRYRVGDVERSLADCRISCRVKVAGICGPHSGAGLIFRWHDDPDRGHALLLQQGATLTLFERNGNSMRATWSKSELAVDQDGMVRIEIVGRGAQLTISAAGAVVHVVAATPWLDGQPGIGAYGVGEFAFDDVALFLPRPAAGAS